MFIGILFLLIMAAGVAITQVTFGQLIGLFAEVQLRENCHHHRQTFIISNSSDYICPPGINIHSISYIELQA